MAAANPDAIGQYRVKLGAGMRLQIPKPVEAPVSGSDRSINARHHVFEHHRLEIVLKDEVFIDLVTGTPR